MCSVSVPKYRWTSVGAGMTYFDVRTPPTLKMGTKVTRRNMIEGTSHDSLSPELGPPPDIAKEDTQICTLVDITHAPYKLILRTTTA